MPIQAANIIYRSPRRIRVVFTANLHASAFVPSNFAVTSLDDFGPTPTVLRALVVSDSPASVELALGPELVAGAAYLVQIAANIQATDASTTAYTELPLRTPGTQPDLQAQAATLQTLAAVYGEDIVWQNGDWLEGPDGDLLTIGGSENVRASRERDALSEGLLWSSEYGAKLRQFVDGPSVNANEIRAALLRRAQADDRVVSADVKYVVTAGQADEHVFQMSLKLVGNQTVTFPITVPINAS